MDDEILRIAAIMAIISMLEDQGDNPADVGRNPGNSWTQDHLRMNMGMNSLMNKRSQRSPWR